ncbi:glycosyltransferase family 2 protein [Psychrobacter communis]|uniref:Glycosyltransferase n=1 Tax=Psychrobacter communis TaxID=2762238 RepID=A0ABR8RJG5_9GAMM|nr:glycosyltransferase [Psychrobacter communis]MBD7947944.1 glycosyltransferase [Psychrobacter communis]
MKVTIAIPIYNAEKYLELAIQSVLNQSFTDWELLLVDDGSTDKSLEIAKKYEKIDNRVRMLSDGMNKKLPYRLNQIIRESKGNYIARMDSDDLIHPDRLNIQVKFLETNPQYDLVSTGSVSIDNNHKVYGYRNTQKLHTNFSSLQTSYPIIHASVLAKKSWYERNKYNTDYPRSQDYELWCRTSLNNDLKIAILPDLLYYYREEGILDPKKLTSSYINGLRIFAKFSGTAQPQKTTKIALKVALKVIAAHGLNNVGLLQKVAALRNNKDISLGIIKKHQRVVDKIISDNK